MNKLFAAITLLFILPSAAQATTFTTFQGGTGTSSPSGILYGSNSASPLSTTKIGSGLSFSGGTLSNTGLLSNSGDWAGTWQTFSPSHFDTFAWPFTATTWGGAAANATTTNIQFIGTITATSSIGNLTAGAISATSSLTVPLTGILKGNGTSIVSTASNGTDFSLITALSCTAGNHLATVSASGAFTCSADSGSGGNDPFTHTSVFNQTTSATGTLIALTGSPFSLAASNTSAFDNSTTTFATVKTAFWDNSITSALALFDSNHKETAYTGTSPCSANQAIVSLSALGVGTCTSTFVPATRNVNTTFPLQGGGALSGDLTLTNAFSTTTNSGMSAGNLYIGSGGIMQTAASSSIFGFTPISLTSLSATYPLQYNNSTGVFTTAFGTTTTWGIGNNQFIYTSPTGVPLGAASSSLNLPNTALANSSLTVSASTGLTGGGAVSLGGSTSLFNPYMIATSSSLWGVNQVAYVTKTSGITTLASVATTSVSAGTGLTGSLTTLGSGDAIALTVPVVIASGGTNNTSGGTTNGVFYFDGAKYANDNTFIHLLGGAVGVGTSTPWAALSISTSTTLTAKTTPLFAIASSTNDALFNIFGSGFIGIGTSSPWTTLTIDRNTTIATSSIVVTEYKRNATSTSMTIDARDANQQLLQIGVSATTITLNAQTFIPGQKLILTVCNPGTTAGALTWATSNPAGALLWPSDTTPTQTTTANKCDVWSFLATIGTTTATGVGKLFGAQTAAF